MCENFCVSVSALATCIRHGESVRENKDSASHSRNINYRVLDMSIVPFTTARAMARGQYELPQGRTRPVFGPARPPASPQSYGTASHWTRPASGLPLPTSLRPLSTTSKPRTVIVFLSLARTRSYTHNTDILGKRRSEATIKEVDTVEAALDAISGNPAAVVVADEILRDPSFAHVRSEAGRYVQNGGTLLTDPSQIHAVLAQSSNSSPDSTHSAYAEDYLIPKTSP